VAGTLNAERAREIEIQARKDEELDASIWLLRKFCGFDPSLREEAVREEAEESLRSAVAAARAEEHAGIRNRVALVANDQRLAATIHATLKEAFRQSLLRCDFDSIRNHIGRDTNGMLIVVVNSALEAELLYRLSQEIFIQELELTIIVITGKGFSPCHGLDPIKSRLAACLAWPAQGADLVHLVRRQSYKSINTFLGTQLKTLEEVICRRLLSLTPSLAQEIGERVALAAAHDVTVLLTGETGTGKTYLARLMHDCSPRKDRPFVNVPCGALPANLVESAFFGHIRGAFTGADRAKVGKFAAAGNGTLLLDEIDTLGLEQQAGLLRVIETGEYEPVGSNETQICTARIIVASNWDLEEATEKGRFRRDLFYRLNVMSFHLPPLRERTQDIEPLVRGMAARFNTKFRKDLFDVSKDALAALLAFPWPGNIRQLENAVQQAVLVSRGSLLLREHLPQQIREFVPPIVNASGHHKASDESLSNGIEAVERNIIRRALQNNGYSRASAAQVLGISRVTLYKKMKKYGLLPDPVTGARRPATGG
jgi:DNA-binding NtrC family response regulator